MTNRSPLAPPSGKPDVGPPIKQRHLQKCAFCRRGMMHDGAVFFHEVTIRTMIIDLSAVREVHGFETMLGPAAFLAQHMGTDPDIAVPASRHQVFVCGSCLHEPLSALLAACETAADDSDDE